MDSTGEFLLTTGYEPNAYGFNETSVEPLHRRPRAASRGWLVLAMHTGFLHFLREFGLTQPVKGLYINGSSHMTIQSGLLIEILQAFGTTVRWASYNNLSAQDHAAAGITKAGTATVFAWKGDWVTSSVFLSLSTNWRLFRKS